MPPIESWQSQTQPSPSLPGLRAGLLRRQASLQYSTCSQFLAQALRQLMGRPHTVQGLLGSWLLLPLKSRGLMGVT